MVSNWLDALLGGALIGVAVSMMLFLNGRVTGISGIVYGLFSPAKNEFAWRASFIGGLILGGLALQLTMPSALINNLTTSDGSVLLAGVLVGFGTILGSGCTSGHGVCGLSRTSPRSIVATLLFISMGVLTVFVLRKTGVLA